MGAFFGRDESDECLTRFRCHRAGLRESMADAAGADLEPHFMVVPSDLKKLRACLRCYLVKTETQFIQDGCENCPFLRLDEDPDNVYACTTSSFEGIVSIIDKNESWVARWQKLGSVYPGCYCIAAQGELPGHIRRSMDERGVQYHKGKDGGPPL